MATADHPQLVGTADNPIDDHQHAIEAVLSDAINAASAARAASPLSFIAAFLAAALPPRPTAESTAVPADEPGNWSVGGWLRALDLHMSVATALVPPDEATAFDWAKGLSRVELAGKLQEAGLIGLLDVVWTGIAELQSQTAATGSELNSKFAVDASFSMAYGDLPTFHAGLSALIGPPILLNGSVRASMADEHMNRPDSHTPFSSSNGLTTTSMDEWEVAIEPKAGRVYPERTSFPEGDPRCRSPLPLEALLPAMDEHNAKLVAGGHAPMVAEEALGGRLYTGPMYEKYNAVLRSFSGSSFLVARCEQLCSGNHYPTSIHATNSLVLKMSKLTCAGKVYRGSTRGILPRSFWEPNSEGVRGGVELAFSSTTTQRAQAEHYAAGAASTVFEMGMGMVDRGADISWLSQYPHEREILCVLGCPTRAACRRQATLQPIHAPAG